MKEAVIGIDLGGTKSRVGLIFTDSPGTLVSTQVIPTVKNDPEAGVRALVEAIRELTNTKVLLKAVGIGAPGPYDPKTKKYLKLANLPAWQGYPIQDKLRSMLDVLVVAENDANVAALGEQRFGAGRGVKNMIYVSLGTGIGGALVLNGHLYTGSNGYAGEIGHIIVDPGGRLCGCGRRGCVETLASGPAIERSYGKRNTLQVFEGASSKDQASIRVLQEAGRALGHGLAPVITVLDPELVVVGGGMATGDPMALDIYLSEARSVIKENAFLPDGHDVPIMLAKLGDSSGILGAAFLAAIEMEKSIGC
jgi:glucokinase